ncbi:MAG: AMP-binding protein, partial [Verrucomicrobiota bacterium]
MPNLYVTFRESARRQAAKTAVYWGETEWTYRDLLAQSEWVTARLQEQFGIRPGDRVGLWVRNCPEFITALFGILGAGAVAVPINNFLKAAEVSHIAQDAGLRAMVTEMAQEPALGEIRESVPGLPALAIEEFPPAAGLATTGRPAPDGAASALAVLIYTSGTTGRPKGAMLTHGNLLHNVESCRQVLAIVELDRFVLMLPMFHSFMLTACILLPLAVGGSIVLIKSLQHPKHAVGEMIRHQGTILPAMAALFRALAHLPPEVHLPLRLCISGAGPLPAEILKAFNARHPQVPLIEGYGLSEASPVVSVNPVQGPWIAGTIGRPIPDVEMSVQDETGRALPEGEVGEICVRGGNVMQGYWNDPAKTAEALA